MYYYTEIEAGNVCEVIKSYTRFQGRNQRRGKRKEKTPEQMQKQNYRNAVKRLTRLLNCNFHDGDLWVTLTYKKDRRPLPEEAKKQIRNFIKRLRCGFNKKREALKYITVTEYKNKAIHHHLVINNPDEINVAKLLQEKWKEYGIVHIKPLYSGGQYKELAEYMVKETEKTFREQDGGRMQRWSSSRNLKKPKVRYRIIKASRWNPQPKAKKGYVIETDSIVNGVNAYTGREYQTYTMIRLEQTYGSNGKHLHKNKLAGSLKRMWNRCRTHCIRRR